MQITNEHIGRRVQYTGRNGEIKYGTVRTIANKFVDIELEVGVKRTYFVPQDSVVFVDEDGIPLTE